MQTLCKFKAFFNKITAEAGRNYKISVLEEYKNDEDIKYILNFLYNPYITTGISYKKLQKTINFPESFDLVDLYTVKDILEYVKVHNTGRDIDILQVRWSITELVSTGQWDFGALYLFNDIVCKDVQLGVDAKTINKVIPGLIPEFNVQLSNKYFDKPEVVEGQWFAITTKIDGSRIIAIKENGEVSFYTRQGQKYEGLVDLEKELKETFPDNICLDGEIVAINTDLENTYKNTMKLSRTKDQEKHGLKMLVFDCMPVEDFKSQLCSTPYSLRRGDLLCYFSHGCTEECIKRGQEFTKTNYPQIPQDHSEYIAYQGDWFEDQVNFVNTKHTYFQMLPLLYRGRDTAKITEILEEQVAKGEEGIMVNLWNAPYEFKRTNNLLKVKKFQDTELKIIGFEEGTNKLAGTLGAFICEYKGNTVKVGSGLSDEDRAYFWNNKVKFLGRYITVKYFETSTDSKTGLESLRFPIYMRVREDMPTIPLDVNGPRFDY